MRNDLKDKNSEAYKEKLEIAMRAFNSGCLIYSQDTFNLYTPREFIESNEKVVIAGAGLDKYSNFTLIYPKQAIERKLEDLRKSQEEFEGFMSKVLSAFIISPMDSKTKK